MEETGTETSKRPQFSETSPLEERTAAPSAPSAPRNPSNKRPILICEDDDDIRDLLMEAIESEGFQTTIARNGREALAILREKPGRYLLLLDLMMPDISGYDILEQMGTNDALLAENVVVILSATGFIRPINPVVLEKKLVKAMLKKPFELDELYELLHRFA
jgi:CheY-like chemotaxis protein